MFSPETTEGIKEGGQGLLLELDSGDWLSVLPFAGGQVVSWFRGTPTDVHLVVGHFGTARVTGDIPVLAYGCAADPYSALRLAWEAIAAEPSSRSDVKLRESKDYPEVFRYLGWCSWEQYKWRITDEQMIAAIQGIEKSGLPIRYTLLDDGHFDRKSLQPHAIHFPKGYSEMLALRKPGKIRWMGIWWAIFGETHAVDAPGNLGELSRFMWTSHSNELLPIPESLEANEAFYEFLLAERSAGFDFLKLDFQERPLLHYAGLQKLPSGLLPHGERPEDNRHACANPYAAHAMMMRVAERRTVELFQGMINCTGVAPWCLFLMGDSVVTRCSGDYKVGSLAKAKSHLTESYRLMPWIGQIAWGDHDMFHSNDPFAGRVMAASKAMSGGPVYLSDDPDHFDPAVIRPLCYEDGRLLRPLAPAAPLAEDLFFQGEDEQRLFRVSAPLAHRCVAFAVYNMQGEPEGSGPRFTTTLTAAHYAEATVLMQPYPGPWEVPTEGLVCYDVYERTATLVGEGVPVEITGFGDRLFQFSPIREGWAIIGRIDKFLPGAAIEVLVRTRDNLRLRLEETGPLAIWLAEGQPQAPGFTFEARGGGLFFADISVEPGAREITITR